jgi:hypothetical protein
LGKRCTCQHGKSDAGASQLAICSGVQPLVFQHSGLLTNCGWRSASTCQRLSNLRRKNTSKTVAAIGIASRKSKPAITYSKEVSVSIFSSALEPIPNFPSAHPFSGGDEESKWDQNSDQDKKGKCNGTHGILLSLPSPLVYEKAMRNGIRQTPDLLIGGSSYDLTLFLGESLLHTPCFSPLKCGKMGSFPHFLMFSFLNVI